MRGYNRAIIMGNVARDPEIRYTASQKAVASFSVAVNRSWKDANGELREEVAFIPVVVWGKAAENCERYLRKGSGVLVDGRINTRNYESKTGEKRYVTEIVAETGAEKGQKVKEIKGGSWYAHRTSCRTESRGEGRAPSLGYNTVGFRVVREDRE